MSLFNRRKRRNFAEHLAIKEIDELHNLAENAFHARMALKLSQEDVAERSSLTQPQVANIEAGHGNPTVRTLARLAAGLDSNVADLFRAEESVSVYWYDTEWTLPYTPVTIARGEASVPSDRGVATYSWMGEEEFRPIQEPSDEKQLEEDTAGRLARAS